MADQNDTDDPDTITIEVTKQELRVIHQALLLTSTMVDALGQARRATLTLQLAYRLLPGGIRRDGEDDQ